MASILKQERKSGSPEVLFGDVSAEHLQICIKNGKHVPTLSQMHSICRFLSRNHMVIAEESKVGDLNQKVQLNINTSDLITSLGEMEDSLLSRLFKND